MDRRIAPIRGNNHALSLVKKDCSFSLVNDDKTLSNGFVEDAFNLIFETDLE